MRHRVPVRIQVSQTECGLACCLAVLEHLGCYRSFTDARRCLRPGRSGLSIIELQDYLRDNGCEARSYRAGTGRLTELPLPAIVFWEKSHFVVLEHLGRHRVGLMDPGLGRRTVSRAAFEESYSGVVLTATRGPGFQPRRRQPLHQWRLPGLTWDLDLASTGVIAATTVLTYLVTLVMPMITAHLVDQVTGAPAGAGMSARTLLLATAAAVVLYVAVEYVRTLATSRVVRRLGAGLMQTSFGHLLRLPLSYFATRVPGELMQRLAGVNYLRDTLSSQLVSSLFDLGTTVVVLGYIWVVSPQLGLAATAILVLLLTFLLLTRQPLSRAIDEEITALMEAQGVQYDAVSSIAQIKIGGYTTTMESKWRKEYDRSLTALHSRMRWQNGIVGSVSAAFQLFGPFTLLLYGTTLPTTSLGQAVAVSSLAATMLAGVSGLLGAYTDFITCSNHLDRLEDIIDTAAEPTGGGRSVISDGRIELENLSFRYANESVPVLDGVSLTIRDGEMTALVGQSGSGKTTLAKVLCSLYAPSSGQVRIGGHLLEDYDRDVLRRHIGYVPQDVTLHNGTLMENLALGSDIPEEEIVRRCRSLGFLDFIDSLPMGYYTQVSDLGANFSGGQRQRLAIARALLRHPRIMVLDEATSALDRLNEHRVNKVLRDLGCTRVVIAHRLETVRSADTIYVMDSGRVVEHGTHQSLIQANSIYAALYKKGAAA
ncbi:cytolysin B transporter [Actinomyces sp. 432]|uniref:peptidase domain-containing ABC transporter n=1 Tax=Actinomyces sp. 432 TaxID=2057798 RepID=UPI00137439A2|nr:peptidase domain-containing ABC transporter [Actinomyces sp. 432]QHO90100.1 cytolysin B transporter [Actinomyces sp. 432]